MMRNHGFRHGSRHRSRAIAAVWLAIALPLLAACDTEALLDVDTPGKVPDEVLSDPALAATLVASVVADAECAFDNYVGAAAHHGDEFIESSGNLLMKNWGTRRIDANLENYYQGSCGGGGYGIYNTLHTARFQANTVFENLSSDAFFEVPDLADKKATVRAYGGFSELALAEGFCEIAFNGTQVVTPDALLAIAVEHLTEALALAREAGNDDLMNLALVSIARAKLNLEDFAGTIEAASQVPPGFRFDATRDGSTDRRYNTHFEMVNDPDGDRHATVAPNYRALEWKGVPDPRVHVETQGELGFDFVTPHWFHDKVLSRETPVRMASWEEAQLFIAEAAARTGDLDNARTILDGFHTRAGIPPVTAADIPTQADVIRHVLEERRRELFVEGGHRLNDMLRFRGTEFEIPFLGEPGSIHPEGVDHVGVPYGSTTCFPLPAVEAQIG